jgi:hypothetical protein
MSTRENAVRLCNPLDCCGLLTRSDEKRFLSALSRPAAPLDVLTCAAIGSVTGDVLSRNIGVAQTSDRYMKPRLKESGDENAMIIQLGEIAKEYGRRRISDPFIPRTPGTIYTYAYVIRKSLGYLHVTLSIGIPYRAMWSSKLSVIYPKIKIYRSTT